MEFCVSASISPVQGCYIAVVWFPLCFFCYLCFTRFFPIIVIGFSPVETLCFVFCFFFPFILSGGPLDTSRFLEVFVLVVHVVWGVFFLAAPCPWGLSFYEFLLIRASVFSPCLHFRLRRPVLGSCYPRNSARQTKRPLLLRLPRSFLTDLGCKTCRTSRASTLWRWKCQVATGHLSTIHCTGLELRPRNLKNLSTAGMTILASSTICIFRSPKHCRSTHPSRFFSP